MQGIRIVQLPIFSSLVDRYLTELEYWELQETVAAQPDLGALIPGGKGLRKLRWAIKRRGKGKSGGIRVIYYWLQQPSVVYFLTLYAKSTQENLTKEQLKIFAALVERELK